MKDSAAAIATYRGDSDEAVITLRGVRANSVLQEATTLRCGRSGMGWSGGSELGERTWALVRQFVPPSEIKQVAEKFISAFEDEDADDFGPWHKLWKDAERPDDEDD